MPVISKPPAEPAADAAPGAKPSAESVAEVPEKDKTSAESATEGPEKEAKPEGAKDTIMEKEPSLVTQTSPTTTTAEKPVREHTR